MNKLSCWIKLIVMLGNDVWLGLAGKLSLAAWLLLAGWLRRTLAKIRNATT